jgi:hypothetical protein
METWGALCEVLPGIPSISARRAIPCAMRQAERLTRSRADNDALLLHLAYFLFEQLAHLA